MLFPRLLAFSEISWTPDNLKNWDNFVKRTETFMDRLDVMKIKYARSMYQVLPAV